MDEVIPVDPVALGGKPGGQVEVQVKNDKEGDPEEGPHFQLVEEGDRKNGFVTHLLKPEPVGYLPRLRARAA